MVFNFLIYSKSKKSIQKYLDKLIAITALDIDIVKTLPF